MKEKSNFELRSAEVGDATAIAAFSNLPGVRNGTLWMPYDPRSRVERRIAENARNHFLVGCVHEEDAEKIIAYGGLMPRTRRAAHVGEIFLLVHDDHTGCGYGTCILQALLDLADNWLGLRRVELEVNADNAPAIHLYTRHGFEVEGTKRGDALRDGVLIDTHIMGRLREAPVRQAPNP